MLRTRARAHSTCIAALTLVMFAFDIGTDSRLNGSVRGSAHSQGRVLFLHW